MTDLQIIKQIEQQIGFPLKQLPKEKIYDETKHKFVKEKFDKFGIIKGLRAYSVDKENNVTSVSLDYISNTAYDYSVLTKFKFVDNLSLRGGGALT